MQWDDFNDAAWNELSKKENDNMKRRVDVKCGASMIEGVLAGLSNCSSTGMRNTERQLYEAVPRQ